MDSKKLLILFAAHCAQSLAQTTMTFSYTGAVQTYTIPVCVTSITVDAQGAAGGSGDDFFNNFHNYSPGGKGGRARGTIAVSSGDILYIYVGGKGSNGTAGWMGGAGGYNGGGAGNLSSYPITNAGGGGGGTSDIRLNGSALSNRILAAGGGGGGGGRSTCVCDTGGNGGNLVGASGYCWGVIDLNSGSGGSQTAGGTGGSNACTAGSGSVGVGGNSCYDGGGGGGGYYGGGGGSRGGGGGGSSYTASGATNVIHTQGFQTGNGIVSITVNCITTGIYQPSADNARVSVFPNPFSEYATLEVNTTAQETLELVMYDLTGNEVKRIRNIQAGSMKIERDNLENGLYLYRLFSKSAWVASGKIIVQ